MQPSINLAKAVAVTAELTGTNLSETAIQVMLGDLSRYPEAQVMGALTKCRRELKGRLTIADVISRLDDGRPGVEEAWAMLPKDEYSTAVWTSEMSRASAVVHDLMARGDEVAARMAFKEAYNRLCQEARDKGERVSWSASLGWDKGGRESALKAAVVAGRLTQDQAKIYLPEIDMQVLIANAPAHIRPRLVSVAERAHKDMLRTAV